MPLGTTQQTLQVLKYIPSRMFGFVGVPGATDPQVFFHLRVFRAGETPAVEGCGKCAGTPCDWLAAPVLPIVGEFVTVTLEEDPTHPTRTRAALVQRNQPALLSKGTVETFDASRGYGFIKGSDSLSYYLHRSEVGEGRIPLIGQTVVFYTATRVDKARACHVKICRETPR